MSAPKEAASILVCFAVPPEAAPLARSLRSSGSLGVELLVTGMGETNARRETTLALDRTARAFVLTCGFAGALAPGLRVGDLVFDTDAAPGSAAPITNALRAAGASPAKFHCADRVAVTVADKQRVREMTGADVIEMESGVIRELCRARRIPSATLRVISDAASDDLPLDFNAVVDEQWRLSPWRMARWIFLHPSSLRGLLRLQKHTRQAAERLAEAVLDTLDALATESG